MAELTQEKLRHLFDYDSKTGFLVRRVRAGNQLPGTAVGSLDGKGYLHVIIEGRCYRVHRLVWLHQKGWLPDYLDHINRVRTDNRLENLRPVTLSQNHANRQANKQGKTAPFKGVYRNKRGAYIAQTKVKGRTLYLGSYRTPAAAYRAYARKMREIHGDYFSG